MCYFKTMWPTNLQIRYFQHKAYKIVTTSNIQSSKLLLLLRLLLIIPLMPNLYPLLQQEKQLLNSYLALPKIVQQLKATIPQSP